ncbi:MAG: peptide-methionine (S)-S-oxide reductase MsrA [Deltaproteobacteria bacterium]|nr:peptide-methionine (S)-S-oxide reductase MsrA [Deltaproteobacteria bacterium]
MHTESEFATFAGGCFWCTEHAFLEMPGVLSVTSGYTGGDYDNPTYEDVCAGHTGHAEAVRIKFDPAKVAYRDLLDTFWRSIDPTDEGGQFADRGSQYRSVIFYHSADQKKEAEASRDAINASGRFPKPVATAIEPAGKFFPAEDYHQKYCLRNPTHFRSYHHGSGKADSLDRMWRDPEA